MAGKLPNELILDYQLEYKNTDITIPQLCEKYGVVTKQLPGYTKWEKDEKKLDIEIVPEPTPPAIPPERDLDIPSTPEELAEDIATFKSKAVAHAVKFMEQDVQFAEIKEFKDMVAIVDSIEKSYKGVENPGNTINIAIQNLVQKFSDDC